MKKQFLILVLALQSLFIVGATVWNESVLLKGRTVLLETVPVDPRDLLRGDYVILRYKISDVASSMLGLAPGASLTPGARLYVLLEQRGNFHEIKAASTQPLKPGRGEVLLAGQAEDSGSAGSLVRVLYGLESYFVREGTGQPTGKLTVQAAIASDGTARIKQVFIDGKPYADVMKQK